MQKSGLGRLLSIMLIAGGLSASIAAPAAAQVALDYERAALEAKWRGRIQSFLDHGVVPLVDLESSLKRRDGEVHLADALAVMDRLGLALIAFDGYQAKRRGAKTRGYRWGYYIHEVVNAHPDRFILATNGGTNRNWLKGKGSFIGQLEEHVRSGQYPIIGELDFRHYMSGSQCKRGRTDRDTDLPLDGVNGERLFRLSAEIGVPFAIHHEPEDHALDALEKMLKAYPAARVIVAHFGQIRFPEKETRFGPDLVRRLLSTYPNLYYDLSTGQPNRRYRCNDKILDTVIWQDAGQGRQTGVLKPEYKAILTEFSDRFVVGTDYGGGRRPLPDHLARKIANIRLILRDLPDAAKHDIGYRNAWKLLTGRRWAGGSEWAAAATPEPGANADAPPRRPRYKGVISDGHGHFKGRAADPDGTIRAMDRNNIDVVLLWVKRQSGWTDDDTLAFAGKYPGRVVPGIAFQTRGWTGQKKGFMEKVRRKAGTGKFRALGEVSVRGKIGGNLNAPPDSPLLMEVLDISVEFGLPVTIHHNPYRRAGGGYERTVEYETFIEETLAHDTRAVVIWAHWCGQSAPDGARKLLERFPNLTCELAWLHKPLDDVATRLVDENSRFLPGWKTLIEDLPGRFIVGVDSSATPGNLAAFDRRVRKIRIALGGLTPETARKVATANLHRLFRRP
jgi:predicted TIM-barrel fold metal-dependent hydrolase